MMTSRFTLLMAIILMLTLPLSALADDRVNRKLTVLEPETTERLDPAFEKIMNKMDDDLDYILSAPFRLTPKGTALAGLTIITTLFLLDLDEQYQDDISNKLGGNSEYAYGRLRVMGRHVPELTAGLYLLGYFADGTKLKSRALEGFEAMALTALISASSALVIGHAPPNEGGGSGEFESFSDFRSMPDINSALTFSLASVLAYDKGIVEQFIYYLIATGVGFSRVYYEEAWPSDVFLGSVIGTAVGRTVAALSRKPEGSALSVMPVLSFADRPAVGLRMNLKF